MNKNALTVSILHTIVSTVLIIGVNSQFQSEFFSYALIIPATLALVYVIAFQRLQIFLLKKIDSENVRYTYLLPLVLPIVYKIAMWSSEPMSLFPLLDFMDEEFYVYFWSMFFFNFLLIFFVFKIPKKLIETANIADPIKRYDEKNEVAQLDRKICFRELMIFTVTIILFTVIMITAILLINEKYTALEFLRIGPRF